MTVCANCGKPLVKLPPKNTVRTNGWAHREVNGSPLEEPCRINPQTLRNERGTTYAAPVSA